MKREATYNSTIRQPTNDYQQQRRQRNMHASTPTSSVAVAATSAPARIRQCVHECIKAGPVGHPQRAHDGLSSHQLGLVGRQLSQQRRGFGLNQKPCLVDEQAQGAVVVGGCEPLDHLGGGRGCVGAAVWVRRSSGWESVESARFTHKRISCQLAVLDTHVSWSLKPEQPPEL